MRYAGFWLRFVAFFIDLILYYLFKILGNLALNLDLAFINPMSISTHSHLSIYAATRLLILSVVFCIIHWLYFTLLESSKWQATIGKKLIGLKVTDENGERINFGRANARYWSKIISGMTLGIGFIMAGFTEKKQALHDIIARTLVVRK